MPSFASPIRRIDAWGTQLWTVRRCLATRSRKYAAPFTRALHSTRLVSWHARLPTRHAHCSAISLAARRLRLWLCISLFPWYGWFFFGRLLQLLPLFFF